MPTGCLPDIVNSLRTLRGLKPETIIPLQGPAIKGRKHVIDVITRHLEFFEACIDNDGAVPKSWLRPAQTALWLTPNPPWPLEEKEETN
tara:strand:+ start:37 stop:303 length:267 start_codon:yes stop_codon:yes gene_type:complete